MVQGCGTYEGARQFPGQTYSTKREIIEVVIQTEEPDYTREARDIIVKSSTVTV